MIFLWFREYYSDHSGGVTALWKTPSTCAYRRILIAVQTDAFHDFPRFLQNKIRTPSSVRGGPVDCIGGPFWFAPTRKARCSQRLGQFQSKWRHRSPATIPSSIDPTGNPGQPCKHVFVNGSLGSRSRRVFKWLWHRQSDRNRFPDRFDVKQIWLRFCK